MEYNNIISVNETLNINEQKQININNQGHTSYMYKCTTDIYILGTKKKKTKFRIHK